MDRIRSCDRMEELDELAKEGVWREDDAILEEFLIQEQKIRRQPQNCHQEFEVLNTIFGSISKLCKHLQGTAEFWSAVDNMYDFSSYVEVPMDVQVGGGAVVEEAETMEESGVETEASGVPVEVESNGGGAVDDVQLPRGDHFVVSG